MKIEAGLESEKIIISSLGYQSRYLSIDSLVTYFEGSIAIHLQPVTLTLEEVIISASRPQADELLREAMEVIPQNYSQDPFNLELYSRMTLNDSLVSVYGIETILLTYRKGYVSDGANWSRILQKREWGTSPLQPAYDKTLGKEYFPYTPGFDISLIDQIGVGAGSRYTVFNPKKFNRMNFGYVGISVFGKDTVAVIEYALRKKDVKDPSERLEGRYNGIIYVAINNLAIVRHTLAMGRGSKFDIIYRKTGSGYFPYSIRSERPVYAEGKRYSLVQTVSLRNIRRTGVEVIENRRENWHPEDVPFNKEYWDENYPERTNR
jgi:hypothetical protein